MDKWNNNFLKELNKERTNYADMVDFCADGMILNNYIIPELEKCGFYFDVFCGDYFDYFDAEGNEISREEFEKAEENGEEVTDQPKDIYQYFIIDSQAAERFQDYTNELIIYCDALNLYILCVCHFGTSWKMISPNWKQPEEETEE